MGGLWMVTDIVCSLATWDSWSYLDTGFTQNTYRAPSDRRMTFDMAIFFLPEVLT